MSIKKLLRLPEQLWERVEKYLVVSGFTFTEFAKKAIDEALKKEGF